MPGTTTTITEQTVDAFIAQPEPGLLVFTGSADEHAFAQDVSAVARELMRQVRGLRVGVVAASDTRSLMQRFKVTEVPTVLFLKAGTVMSTLARLQDWSVYTRTALLLFGARSEPES